MAEWKHPGDKSEIRKKMIMVTFQIEERNNKEIDNIK